MWSALGLVERGADGRFPIRESDDPVLALSRYMKAVAVREGLRSGLKMAVTTSARDQAEKWRAIAEEAGASFEFRTIDPGEEVATARLTDSDGNLEPECTAALARWYGSRSAALSWGHFRTCPVRAVEWPGPVRPGRGTSGRRGTSLHLHVLARRAPPHSNRTAFSRRPDASRGSEPRASFLRTLGADRRTAGAVEDSVTALAEAADVSDLLGYSPSDEAPTPSATKPSRLTSAPALLLRPALSSWVQMAAKR